MNVAEITAFALLLKFIFQAPINDHNATTTIIGLTPETRKAHIIRAMLESLAFCVKLIYETVLIETKIPLGSLK